MVRQALPCRLALVPQQSLVHAAHEKGDLHARQRLETGVEAPKSGPHAEPDSPLHMQPITATRLDLAMPAPGGADSAVEEQQASDHARVAARPRSCVDGGVAEFPLESCTGAPEPGKQGCSVAENGKDLQRGTSSRSSQGPPSH